MVSPYYAFAGKSFFGALCLRACGVPSRAAYGWRQRAVLSTTACRRDVVSPLTITVFSSTSSSPSGSRRVRHTTKYDLLERPTRSSPVCAPRPRLACPGPNQSKAPEPRKSQGHPRTDDRVCLPKGCVSPNSSRSPQTACFSKRCGLPNVVGLPEGCVSQEG